MTKATIKILNQTAQEDFEKAQAMLDGINLVLGNGKKYGWLRKRVIVFLNSDGDYRHIEDAWVCDEA